MPHRHRAIARSSPPALAALLGAWLAAPAPVTGQLGVLGGFSRDSFGESSGSEITLADRTDGFHTGIFIAFDMGPLGVRPAIVFRELPGAVLPGGDQPAVDVEIIEIPLDIRIKAPLSGLTPYLLAGPVVMFPSSARDRVDDALVGSRVRFDFGIGLEWDLGFRIWPEIRYGRSVGSLLAGDTTDDSDMETFMVRLGVSF